MPPQISKEMRRLQARWETKTGWPKRLDYLEIDGIRGWTGQRFELPFPIMAIVGENGAGKSTILQAAASIYASEAPASKSQFASDFFPDTPWDEVSKAEIRYAVHERNEQHVLSVRKPTHRWRGNLDRRGRNVEYIDLSRVQPVSARVGYARLANRALHEGPSQPFAEDRLDRLSAILGRDYDLARIGSTADDPSRGVPIVSLKGQPYSGFHQGAGETTIMELLQRDMPRYSLVVVDEIESSLHPRAQRRLMRDLADRCRENELQVILSTHSPTVLDELPLEARAYIIVGQDGEREIVYGVSPDFAMTKMDEMPHYEIDLYVEDERAGRMLMEILAFHDPDLALASHAIPYGASSVGHSLGIMVAEHRFPKKAVVFLDGDSGPSRGCLVLPGEDAPERVVFEALSERKWNGLEQRLARAYPAIADACERAMTGPDHHLWVHEAASRLVLSADFMWEAMAGLWAAECLSAREGQELTGRIREIADVPAVATIRTRPEFGITRVGVPASAIELQPPPELWPDAAQD